LKKSDAIMLKHLRLQAKSGEKLGSHLEEIRQRLEAEAAREVREALRLVSRKARKAPARKPKYPVPKNRRMP